MSLPSLSFASSDPFSASFAPITVTGGGSGIGAGSKGWITWAILGGVLLLAFVAWRKRA